MSFTLPELPYALDALEPHISRRELDLHYNTHHRTYCTKLNETIASAPDLATHPVEELVDNLDLVPEAIRTKVRNFGGGLANHTFYWKCLSPEADKPVPERLRGLIEAKWGSMDAFKAAMKTSGLTLFGSGWTWLVCKPDGTLDLVQTPNQDRPCKCLKLLLTLDVWEHAYAYQYDSNRGAYIDAIWHIIDWDAVDKRLD